MQVIAGIGEINFAKSVTVKDRFGFGVQQSTGPDGGSGHKL